MEKIKAFLTKVLAWLKVALAWVKKAFKAIKTYGFGVVNFLVLLLLYGVAYINVDTKGFVIAIGGLWILFIGGKFLYWLFKRDGSEW